MNKAKRKAITFTKMWLRENKKTIVRELRRKGEQFAEDWIADRLGMDLMMLTGVTYATFRPSLENVITSFLGRLRRE